MKLFPWRKKEDFFTAEEKEHIIEAIQSAEQRTSGEIRIFVEHRCRFVNALDRAAEIFWGLKMDQTKDRNGVLIYIAIKDHQYAIYADSGIHEKVGETFWQQNVLAMNKYFKAELYAGAVMEVIKGIGEALHEHFPYNREADKNELPDDIVFGD